MNYVMLFAFALGGATCVYVAHFIAEGRPVIRPILVVIYAFMVAPVAALIISGWWYTAIKGLDGLVVLDNPFFQEHVLPLAVGVYIGQLIAGHLMWDSYLRRMG